MTQQIQAAPKLVDIPTAEYTERRHVAEHCRWINEKLEAIKEGGRFDEQYFERLGLNVKKLIEEAIPISRLGLFRWTPGSDVYITCYADNRDYDAEVEITGFDARSFKVEVTTTETDKSTFRRQALSREGTVPLVGRIRKQKRIVIPEYEMIDVDEQSEKYVALTMERLQAKVKSRRWDGITAILVYLADFWPLPSEGRAKLMWQTERYLEREQPKVPAVYFCYMGSYSVDAVYSRSAR